MNILRGDIFFVKALSTDGSEQKGDRPAIIVSNNTGNHFSGVVEVVYLTTSPKTKLPTHVEIACKKTSIALCEQIHSVSKSRIGEYIRTCRKEKMEKINEALMISLALKKRGDEE